MHVEIGTINNGNSAVCVCVCGSLAVPPRQFHRWHYGKLIVIVVPHLDITFHPCYYLRTINAPPGSTLIRCTCLSLNLSLLSLSVIAILQQK